MIIEETIDGIVFQEQTTFYGYKSEKDKKEGNWYYCTSDRNEHIRQINIVIDKHLKKSHEH